MSEFFKPGVNPGINPIQHDPYFSGSRRPYLSDFSNDFCRNLRGEAGLVAAIVWRAYADLKLPRRTQEYRSARCFFLCPLKSSKHRFTFLYCCEVLAICPYKILRFLFRCKLLPKV